MVPLFYLSQTRGKSSNGKGVSSIRTPRLRKQRVTSSRIGTINEHEGFVNTNVGNDNNEAEKTSRNKIPCDR